MRRFREELALLGQRHLAGLRLNGRDGSIGHLEFNFAAGSKRPRIPAFRPGRANGPTPQAEVAGAIRAL